MPKQSPKQDDIHARIDEICNTNSEVSRYLFGFADALEVMLGGDKGTATAGAIHRLRTSASDLTAATMYLKHQYREQK